MLRRIVCSVAFAALAVTTAQAQTNPFTESFTVVSDGGSGQNFNSYFGRFNLPDALDLGAGFPTGAGTQFQIWCVDENDDASLNNTYSVWVTPLSTSDFSKVYKPLGAPTNYRTAAALSTEMVGNSISAFNDNVQYSIWDVLGYTRPPTTPFGDYNSSQVNADEAIAAAFLNNVNLNQWLVITEVAADGRTQEFIFNDASRPFETPVPEPGAMGMLALGLVGMAGAGLRRKNQK